MTFKDINFGDASAETESARSPLLLTDGYLNINRIVEEALQGYRFLFLGNKGSGKTALAEHIRLMSLNNPCLFSRLYVLRDFPYSRFLSLLGVEKGTEGRLPTAWSWILLITLLDSFGDDAGSNVATDSDYYEALSSFRKIGILPAKDLRELVLASAQKKVKASILSKVGIELEYSPKGSDGDDLKFLHLVAHLKKLCFEFKSENQHIIILDGLDNAILGDPIQYHSIATLIDEASALNGLLKRNSIQAKYIVLCRIDLFEKLPGANKNKTKQDYSVEIDWCSGQQPKDSPLIKLANRRAQISIEGLTDLFAEFFPPRIFNRNIHSVLLEYTRRTPRDFLQLLKHIQLHSDSGILTYNQIRDGILDYSQKYFLTEIQDELYGIIERETVDIVFRSISSLRKNFFSIGELEKKLKQDEPRKDFALAEILRAFYEGGVIGNTFSSPDGSSKNRYKFTSPVAQFSVTDNIVIHRALAKALFN
ncbi:MAG: hypothetical protein GX465_05635 [Acidobacteria bacterium]|nr:hypothetical protein [Acidobacteriota bacterium]